MTTSLTTSEHRIRDWLLDLLHAQWRALGVPFSAEQPARAEEVIDPEALLWCSLEFFPTQPRFAEQVLAWWEDNSQTILLPRIRKFAKGDPRASIWRVLDPKWKGGKAGPTAPCYGQSSVDELLEFCARLTKQHQQQHDQQRRHHQQQSQRQLRQQRHQPGEAARTNATVVPRARDLLGTDARHFILVYLLANRGGAKLRSVATWSGQSYRNIAKVAQRWESANVLALDHGFARLKEPGVWESLLDIKPPRIVLLNWPRFYDAAVGLLRSIEKTRSKSLPPDGPVVSGLLREASAEAEASIETEPSTGSATIQDFRLLLTNLR